jgi:hypothetical protein
MTSSMVQVLPWAVDNYWTSQEFPCNCRTEIFITITTEAHCLILFSLRSVLCEIVVLVVRCFCAVKMEGVGYFEILVPIYNISLWHIHENYNPDHFHSNHHNHHAHFNIIFPFRSTLLLSHNKISVLLSLTDCQLILSLRHCHLFCPNVPTTFFMCFDAYS